MAKGPDEASAEPTEAQRNALKATLVLEATLRRMYRVAYAICGDHHIAEDVVADAIVRSYQRLDQLENIERLLPWLLSLVRSIALDHHRRRRTRQADALLGDGELVADPEVLDGITAAAETEEAVLTQEIVTRALRTLGADDRTLLFRRFVGGVSHEVLAKELGLPSVEAARARLCRLVKRLRDLTTKARCA